MTDLDPKVLRTASLAAESAWDECESQPFDASAEAAIRAFLDAMQVEEERMNGPDGTETRLVTAWRPVPVEDQ
jgi:hypothetical protein